MDDKPDFKFEKTLITPEKNHIAGVDEAGRLSLIHI